MTDIQVANIALDWLKEGAISSFDDDRPSGRWMNRNFKIVRDMTIALTPWRFAVHRNQLPEAMPKPEFEYQYAYIKPSDCLRVMPLRQGGYKDGALIRYSVEGDRILTNAPPPLKVRCIMRIEDATKWSPLFIDVFSLQLALRLGNWLTGKETFVARIASAYKESLTTAMFIDTAEGYAEDQVASYYDDVRYS
jgi:hypothetical protein